MAVYNTTNLTESGSDLIRLTQELNILSDQVIGIMMFLTIMVVFFITFRLQSQQDFTTVFSATMFMGVIIAVLMEIVGLIPGYIITVMAVTLFLAVGLQFIPRRA